jgi:hypothetical protein
MSRPRIVERREDMSPVGKLVLIEQQDGDVIVVVEPDPDHGDRQDWAHDFMADGGWRAMSEAVRGLFKRPAGGVAIKRQGPASPPTGEVP